MYRQNVMVHSVEVLVNKTLDIYPYARTWENHFPSNQICQYRPDWSYSPLADCIAMLKNASHMSEAPTAHLMLGDHAEFILLTAALSWTYTREIYNFDATLLTELLAKPLAQNFSVDDLMQLPEPCVYIEAPIAIGEQTALGFFVWIEYDVNSDQRKAKNLLFVFNMSDGSVISHIYKLSDITETNTTPLPELSKSVKMTMMSPAIDENEVTQEIEPLPNDLKNTIQLVLYLCQEESDTFNANNTNHPDENAEEEMESVNVWKVGFRIGNAIRKYSNLTTDEQHVYERNGHISLRPHIRRAHWHSYWLGTKENKTRNLVVRWMPSMLVGAAWKQELPTVVWRLA